MTKQETYDYLRDHGVAFEISEHEAVFNMEDCAAAGLPYPQDDAKNLFVREDKRTTYFLISVRPEKRVDLKEFRRQHDTRRLTFATAEEMEALLGVYPGAVTPLGLLNDREHRVRFFLDRDFLRAPGRIGVHPNDNTATVWLQAEELLRLLREAGCQVELTEL